MSVRETPRREVNLRIFDQSRDPPRVDGRDKVTGRAKYVEDLPEPPGIAYAAPLLSPYSHARILSIDSSEAERLSGVLGIVDREHLDGFNPLLSGARHELFKLSPDQTFITTDKVRFDGELVALVAAEDLRIARSAIELIRVEYEPLAAVFDGEDALSPGAPLLHEAKGSNLLLEDKLEWGNVEEGLKNADRIFEETYTSPSMFHHPMESVGGCVAQFIDEDINLWVPTSSPFVNANEVAHFFGLDPDQVRIRVPYIGGSFGSKGITTSILAALFLSHKIGRPIKLVPSAEESFRQISRHAIVYKAKVGVKADGTLVALDVDLLIDTGAYTTGAATATHNAVISAWGCYRIPHLHVRGRCAYTNKVPASHARATGKVQTTWGIECTVDSVAHRIGIDPIEFRKKNVLLRGEFVAQGTPVMDTDYSQLMGQAISAISWDGRSSFHRGISGNTRSRWARGKGIVISLRHGSQGGGRAYAMATIDPRGTVKIQHNAPEIGQGNPHAFQCHHSSDLRGSAEPD